MKNIKFDLWGKLRKQGRVNNYWKTLYLTSPFPLLLFLVLIPVLLFLFRLVYPSLYSPNITEVFWHESYFQSSVFYVTLLFITFPLFVVPGYSMFVGNYQSYKHIIISERDKFRLILLFLSPFISLILIYQTLPGFFILISSQGYLIPLSPLIAFLLSQVAGAFSIIGIPISHLFKLQLPGKSLPPLIGFTYLRPLKDKVINLDVGAFSPRLKVVIDELNIWHSLVEVSAPTSRDIWHYAQGVHGEISQTWLRKTDNLMWKGVNDLRLEIAEIVNLHSQNIIFVSNTTRAIEVALETLQPKIIVTTDFEHPTEIRLMETWREKHSTKIFKVEVKDNSNQNLILWQDNFVDRFVSECVNRQASLALISHVSYVNGWILPIKEICQELSQKSPTTEVIIDGAHAVGNTAVDLSQIPFTFYAFSGHKWLFSSVNIGMLVLSNKVKNDRLMWNKLNNEIHESLSVHQDQPVDDESTSSINIDSMVAFSASVKSLKETKLENVMNNMVSLKKYFQRAASNYHSFRILDESAIKIPIVPGIINIQSGTRDLNYDELKIIEKTLEQKYGIIVNTIKSPSQNFPDVIRVCLPFYLWEHEVRKAVNAINKAFS